jgi:hypothetical protein
MPSPSSLHALLHEKLDALIADCEQVMDTANYGRTFHDLDDFFCTKGQEFLQEVFKQKLQKRIEKNETAPKASNVLTVKKTQYQNKKTKTVVSVHGHIVIQHRYLYCPHCKKYSFPSDVTLGMETGYTERLCRVITRCCGLWSYRLAKENLQEFFGIRLSHTTLGKIAGHTAEEMAARMRNNPDVRNDFQKAKGRVEFYADGVFVHIRDEDDIARWH